MAVNAAAPMLGEADRARIGLIIVASESGVDQEKPISTWVQRYAGLPSTARNIEVKHACYGATAALQLAASWVAAGAAPGQAALVINTDESRMHLGAPWEFVLGAGATAILVSDNPRLLEIELGVSGVQPPTKCPTSPARPRGSRPATARPVFCLIWMHWKAHWTISSAAIPRPATSRPISSATSITCRSAAWAIAACTAALLRRERHHRQGRKLGSISRKPHPAVDIALCAAYGRDLWLQHFHSLARARRRR